MSPTLQAHLGQPRLGIEDTQEAVGLVCQEAQAGLPRRLGDGHPGQQLSPMLLLGRGSICLTGTPHVHGGPHPSQGRDGPPILQMGTLRLRRTEMAHSKGGGALGQSSQRSAPSLPGMASVLGNSWVSPCHLHAQLPIPPPGPAASGWRRAVGARWPGCCTAAPGH